MAEDLKKELDACRKKAEEYLAGWQRSRADFLNYKKEEMEKISSLMAYAQEEMVLKALPLFDNFNLAEKNLPKNLLADENVKGILQIKSQLFDFLKNCGLEEIQAMGQKFDPNWHESVEEITGTKSPPDLIVGEVQKGYKINGRLLRPAKVKISK